MDNFMPKISRPKQHTEPSDMNRMKMIYRTGVAENPA